MNRYELKSAVNSQALTYLRWHEQDVDLIAPSLYAKGRRKAAPAEAEGAVVAQATEDPDAE